MAGAAAAGSPATGGNHMLLRRPPARPSLLELPFRRRGRDARAAAGVGP